MNEKPQPASSFAQTQGSPSPSTPAEAAAASLLGELARSDWAAAEARFTPKMAQAMPAEKVTEFWQHLLATQGEWGRVDRYTTEKKGGLDVALLDVRFARRRQQLRVSVDAEGHIAGIFRGPIREDAEQEARAMVEALARGDGERVTRTFDATMRTALSAAKAVEAWGAFNADAGAFDRIEGVRFESKGRYLVALVDVGMRSKGLVIEVAFDPDGDVAGLHFEPSIAGAAASHP